MERNPISQDKIHRLFYPVVPVVVTAQAEGRVGGMPAIWCMPLSFTPPLVGVAIAPEHETYRIIMASKHFALNWLDLRYADRIAFLGETSAEEYGNKLTAAGLTVKDGLTAPVPVIDEAAAVVECAVKDRFEAGSHHLLIGSCLAAYAIDDFGDYWGFTSYSPILYAGTQDGASPSWKFISIKGEVKLIPRRAAHQHQEN